MYHSIFCLIAIVLELDQYLYELKSLYQYSFYDQYLIMFSEVDQTKFNNLEFYSIYYLEIFSINQLFCDQLIDTENWKKSYPLEAQKIIDLLEDFVACTYWSPDQLQRAWYRGGEVCPRYYKFTTLETRANQILVQLKK